MTRDRRARRITTRPDGSLVDEEAVADWLAGMDRVRPSPVRPRSAGAHVRMAHEPVRATLTGRMILAGAIGAVGIIAAAAWFLTAFPVPS